MENQIRHVEICLKYLEHQPWDIPGEPGPLRQKPFYSRGRKQEVRRKVGNDGARNKSEAAMKGIKLAREHNPATAHDNEGKKKRVKEESSALRILDSWSVLVAVPQVPSPQIFLLLLIQQVALPLYMILDGYGLPSGIEQ